MTNPLATWLRTEGGDYLNLHHIGALEVHLEDDTWSIVAIPPDREGGVRLRGGFPSKRVAQIVLEKLLMSACVAGDE